MELPKKSTFDLNAEFNTTGPNGSSLTLSPNWGSNDQIPDCNILMVVKIRKNNISACEPIGVNTYEAPKAEGIQEALSKTPLQKTPSKDLTNGTYFPIDSVEPLQKVKLELEIPAHFIGEIEAVIHRQKFENIAELFWVATRQYVSNLQGRP